MNDQDKILINTFVDNETSKEEDLYIENLIKSDKEALEYLNLIKKAHIKINQIFESKKSNRDFQIEKKSSSYNFFNGIINFDGTISKSLVTYGITAAISFGIGTQLINQEYVSSTELYKIISMRSNDSFNSQLKIIISDMVSKKIYSADLESQDYKKIIISPKLDSDCIFFEIDGLRKSIGQYCKDEDIFYIKDIN